MQAKKRGGYSQTIDELVKANMKVFVLRDSPRSKDDQNIPDCLATHNASISECVGQRSAVLVPDPLYEAASRNMSSRVYSLDLSDRFCDEITCYPVIGGVVVYFDSNHISNSYVMTLTADIAAPLIDFVHRNVKD